MKKYKNMMLGLAAFAAMATGAIAANYDAIPANYQQAAEEYVMSRLTDARGASVQFVSDPYPVIADIAGYQGLEAWAVDIRVRSKLPSGARGGYVPYTLIFYKGEPVAFEMDAKKVARADGYQLVANK